MQSSNRSSMDSGNINFNQYKTQMENNRRFVRLELFKVTAALRSAKANYVRAKQAGDLRAEVAYRGQNADLEYKRLILKIANEAIELLGLAMKQQACISVEGTLKSTNAHQYSVVDFDRPRSPSSYGVCD